MLLHLHCSTVIGDEKNRSTRREQVRDLRGIGKIDYLRNAVVIYSKQCSSRNSGLRQNDNVAVCRYMYVRINVLLVVCAAITFSRLDWASTDIMWWPVLLVVS